MSALSDTSRWLTRLMAVLYTALGLTLFVAPEWSAERFGWKVTPFQTMTIGGWAIGNAVVSWEAARVWLWRRVHPLLLYLWCFAILEVGVLIWFNDKILFDEVLAWPYIITLGVSVIAAFVGVIDLLRIRPSISSDGVSAPLWLRAIWFAFVPFIGLLTAVAAIAPDSALDGSIFPENLTPFTLRAFGAFYLALGIGAVPLLWQRSAAPSIMYISRAIAFIVFITIPAFVYIKLFDFTRPAHYTYLGGYFAALILGLIALGWSRKQTGAPVLAGAK